MKVILVSLNSKYIHSNLAIRYLSSYVAGDIDIYEFTINQSPDFIASEIYKILPDMVGFSTYIWNLNETLRVCEILKVVKPEIKILLGGPEVSYDGYQIMKEKSYIDYIIYGEGEATFREFLDVMTMGSDFNKVKGLIYREGSKLVRNEERDLIRDLNTIPFPYEGIGEEFENRIIYYESSRGCPFNCKYCLSSTFKGVRDLSIERVKADLEKLIEAKVRQVKFVDRTFNANKNHAMEIMKFIKEKDPENINFHFEITAHLIDDEMLGFLKDTKKGLFQFEIGVQSTNDSTIDAIGRTTDFLKLAKVVKEIKSFNNIHQHLDLIAGLPYEDYESFKNSFNEVYNLKAEKLQLGFLKLLKGSELRLAKERYGYKYIDDPPYEVLESKYISYQELLQLKGVEDLVEKYYNEGYFEYTLDYIIKKNYKSPIDFFEDLLELWNFNKYNLISHSRNSLYEILLEFIDDRGFEDSMNIREILRFDFKLNNKNSTLKFGYERENSIYKNKSLLHDILRNEEILSKYLIEYKELPTKRIINKVSIDIFQFSILDFINNDYEISDYEETYILFDYKDDTIDGKPFDITKIVREMID